MDFVRRPPKSIEQKGLDVDVDLVSLLLTSKTEIEIDLVWLFLLSLWCFMRLQYKNWSDEIDLRRGFRPPLAQSSFILFYFSEDAFCQRTKKWQIIGKYEERFDAVTFPLAQSVLSGKKSLPLLRFCEQFLPLCSSIITSWRSISNFLSSLRKQKFSIWVSFRSRSSLISPVTRSWTFLF